MSKTFLTVIGDKGVTDLSPLMKHRQPLHIEKSKKSTIHPFYKVFHFGTEKLLIILVKSLKNTTWCPAIRAGKSGGQ